MTQVAKSDCFRLRNINFTMDELYDKLASIYEDMVDRDKQQLRKDINDMIKKLKQISDNTKDEP